MGAGSFCTVYCTVKSDVTKGTKEVLKDNVSTNYVADCSYIFKDNTRILFTISENASNYLNDRDPYLTI